MRKPILKRLFLTLMLMIAFYPLAAQTLNPADPVTRWNEGDPIPAQPAFGQIGKWVAKSVVNWDTEQFKPYIYKGMPFRLMFPKNYDSNKAEGYPVVVMFHGRGEKGEVTDNERQLIHGARNHRDAINNGTYDGFLLYTQNTTGWYNSYLYNVINDLVTNKMPQEINVDLNRIYVHGLSSGAIGVWEMVINYPKFAAAYLPMSGSGAYQNNVLDKLKFTPMWIFQGSEDRDPPPARTTSQVNVLLSLGASVRYTIYEGVGHGTWNRAYNESDFFPFMNRANKVNPWVLYGQSEFCPGESVNVTIGVTAGFNGYEWRKDGVVIGGATGNTINVTEYGVYDVRIRRGSDWSYWSPVPVEIKEKTPTVTPPIMVSGLASKVIPALDGNNSVTLELPEGYETYQWRRVDNTTTIGTSRFLTVNTPGEYIASVSEFNGCSSNFSAPFLVVNANGTNGPDAINGLLAFAPSKTSIQLNWSDNPSATNNETGFEIYRGNEAGGPYELISITNADVLSYTDEGLNPNTEYFYLIRPVNDNAAGPTSDEVSARTQVDTEAPTAPLNLTVTATTENSVSLSWDPSTDNVGVYRYDVYQNGIKALVVEGTSATIFNLISENVYNFTVKARDLTGNESAASNQATAAAVFSGLTYKYYEGQWSVLPDFNALTPAATGKADNVDISIRQQNDNFAFLWEGFINIPVAGTYTFETISDDGSKLYIGEYDEANLVVDNDGLHGSRSRTGTYTFTTSGAYPIAISFFERGGGERMEVYWQSNQGLSRQRIPDDAFGSDFVMPGDAPNFPTNLSAIVVSYEQIDLNWTDNSNNEIGFQIYRSDNPAGPFLPIAIVNANESNYEDTGLEAETTYFYRIMALGQYGESGFSDEINTGLEYSYYEGSFSNLDQLATTTPILTGISSNFDLSPRQRNSNIAFRWEGQISLPSDGEYRFFTRSDDGSELFINGQQIVFNDFNQGMTERSGTINLTAGSYPIVVMWRQGGGGYGLEVRYQGPGINKQLIPDSALGDPDINATTLSLPSAPVAPSGIVATPLTNTSIRLDWIDSSNDEETFEIYRSTNNNNNFLLFETLSANVTSFTDEGLFAGVNYFYKVAAVNVGGRTESPEVSSKTLNTLPELTDISDQTMRFGTTLAINLFSEDADGNTLVYSVQNLPSFGEVFDFGDGTGQIEFNPTTAQQGIYSNITVEVNDQNGGIVQSVFDLLVDDNYVPTLNSIGNQTLNEGSTSSITLNATDLNTTDVLTWSSEGLPPFAILTPGTNGEATLQLNPGLADLGTYTVRIIVEDDKGASSSETFNIVVEDTPVGYTIYLNLNGPDFNAPAPWNNTSADATNGQSFSNLLDDQGNNTNVGITTSDFGFNTLGSTSTSGVYPTNVMRTAYWSSRATETVTIYGLDDTFTYDLTFFGSRNEGTQTNRTTDYTVNGQTVTLNASRNSTETAFLSSLIPNANGELQVTVARAAGSSFSYLNALVIKANFDDGTTPAAPRNVTVSNISGQEVSLSWLDAAYNEDGYEVFRAVSIDGTYTLLNPGGTARDVSAFTDNTVSGSTSYFYKVRAFNGNGLSAFSDPVSVTTPNAPPVLAPVGDVAAVANETKIVEIAATDSDLSDVIALSMSNLPVFTSFVDNGDGTGELTINPALSDEGNYENIVVTATDNNGGTDTETITISVTSGELVTTYINFNRGFNEAAPWNNTNSSPTAGSTTSNLTDETGTSTGMNVTLLDAWAGDNSLGVNTGNNSGIYPDNVIRTSYWEGSTATKRVRFSGLASDKKYNFIFFASRAGGGNRTTIYTIGNESVSLNAAGNATNTVQINGISPNSSGQVTISMRKGGGASYGYINAIVVQSYEDNGLPLSPSDLVAAGTSDSNISLNWVDNSDNEVGFEIWRASSYDGNYSLYHTTAADVTIYNDAVPVNSTYYYQVRAVNAAGNSNYTNIAGGSTIDFTVSVNFNAQDPESSPWNNFNSDPFPTTKLSNLINNTSNNTGISIEIVESSPDYDEFSFGFDGTNPFGMVTGDDSGIVPDNVMRSTYWMDPNKAAQLRVSGLNLAFSYNFVFFASRNGSGNRSTDYTINGRTVTLNAAFNTSNTTQLNGIEPDNNGEAVITVATSPGSSFGYIGGLIIQAYPKPQMPQSNARIADNGLSLERKIVFENLENVKASNINSVYPNPFIDEIFTDIELTALDEISIEVKDVTGKTVMSKESFTLAEGSHRIRLAIDDKKLVKGLYILSINSYELGVKTFKIIKN